MAQRAIRRGSRLGLFAKCALLSLTVLAACDGHDDDFIPYDIEAMDVYVYGDNNRELFAGRIETSYFSAADNLSRAQSLAWLFAREKHLGSDWSYIVCTVTSDSSCATKVR